MKNNLLTYAALALTLAACSNENDPVSSPNDDPLNPAVVSFAAGINTRATVDGTWETTDAIGISATGSQSGTFTNVKYTAATAGATTTFSTTAEPIAFKANEQMTFTAYYPYTETLSDGKVSIDTRTAAGQKDYLFASNTLNYTENPTVSFTFSHKMALVTVKVSENGGDINGKAIKLGGLKHDGTFDTATGIAAPNNDAAAAEWEVGTPGDVTSYEQSACLLPQNASTLTLSVGGESVTLNLGSADGKLNPGYKYIITAEVTNTTINASVTIGGSTINGWSDGGVANVAFIGTAADAASLNEEEKAAYDWFDAQANYNVTYLSATNSSADLSGYKMIWAHFDITNLQDFTSAAINETVKNYYNAGGDLLVSRSAMRNLKAWGIIPDGNECNWVWGEDATRSNVDFAQGITIAELSHAMFNGFSGHLHDINYQAIRKSYCWGENWSDTDLTNWQSATGASRLAYDGGKAYSVTIAEIPEQAGHGCAILIGDPGFEWYNASSESTFANLTKLTANAINYLISK